MNFKNLNSQLYLNFPSEKNSTRRGYGDALLELGRDERIVALCADLNESTCVEEFRKKYPRRFLQVGVAEQNLVTVAAGLAHVGKIPFASSFAIFSPGRNWEQIRTTICYNNQNVKIVGSHTGVSVGADGATHQALEDIALMRCLPNMVVVVPCDYEQAKKAAFALAEHKGPAYLRLSRPKTEQMTAAGTPFKIGRAQIFREGKDLAIIGTGPIVSECLKAASLLEKKKVEAMVINCHTLKPLDGETILKAARKCKKIITVEDAQVIGGLGGAVAEFLSEYYPVPIVRIGVKDRFGESGSPEELAKKFGLTAEDIFKVGVKLVRK